MRTIALIVSFALFLPAQQQNFVSTVNPDSVPTFPSKAFIRQGFGRELPRVEIKAPVRLGDFVVDGKLELSLQRYLELVMANNPDIQIQRLSVEQFKNAITRSYGRFDPFVTSTFSSTRAKLPTNSILSGANVSSTLVQPFNSQYNQIFENGTQLSIGFGATKTSTNDSFATFNPNVVSGLRLGFSQPLLQNRGSAVNKLQIMVARSRLRQGEYNLRDSLLGLIVQAEQAYWQVIQMRENLKVQEAALDVNGKLLKRNERELELGAISALEIYQPKQVYAQAEVQVTVARYNLQQAEDVLRRQFGADVDVDYRNMPIILTENVSPPEDDRPLDKELYVETAFRMRPDLKATLQFLDIDDLNYKQAKNTLTPDLSLTGLYTGNGRGGNFIPRTSDLGSGVTIASQLVPGGIGDALNQVFAFNFPTYNMGLSLRLPLRNRAGQADLADAVLNKRIDTLRARALEQNIRRDVLNAVTRVESSRAAIRQSQIAVNFAQQRLEAEEKRYNLGVSTIFFVLQATTDLFNSQSSLVVQSVQYRRDLLNLMRMTGTLLDDRGIIVN
jgi:HAE1 family hydrophobic/amphiphilic exporter-1